jgi:hypothetical protein
MMKSPLRTRSLFTALLLITASLRATPAKAQVINEPPAGTTSIITFPSRDFVSIGGMFATDKVDVQVFRKGIEIAHALGATQIAGLIDVNHPGGYCWNQTPELRVGDIVRTTAKNPDGTIRQVDQTHVMGVVCQLPVMLQDDDPNTSAFEGIVELHGVAQGLDGRAVPIDQLEARMVIKNDLFDRNAARTLRAGPTLDGTIAYDRLNNPLGLNWTARFSGLDGDDVARLMGKVSSTTGVLFAPCEPRIHWLGQLPVALKEATIYENSPALNPPGPAIGACVNLFEAADTQAPTAPSGLTVTQSGQNVILNWLASTDNWAVWHYRVYRDGIVIANVAGTATTYTDLNAPVGAHQYQVFAYDHASPLGAGLNPILQISAGFGLPYGNVSAGSNLAGTNSNDVTPPSIPQNLVAFAPNGSSRVQLSWSASTDNGTLAGYGVYRAGLRIANVLAGTTSFTDTTLAVGTYVYTVDALDAAGNRSAVSASASAILTATADVTAPTVPTRLAAANSPDIHGRDVRLTWLGSTDNVGVTGYAIYRNGVRVGSTNGATLAFTDPSLPTGTFSYTIDAFDTRGNHSALTAAVSIVVANDPPVANHTLLGFYARDFISATGYPAAEGPYVFSVIRANAVVAQSIPFNSDPTGLIEVNHPGGTCWSGVTPDMRAGDVIRITNAAGIADQTTIQNVVLQRPMAINSTTVQLRGFALDTANLPLSVNAIEIRLISNGGLFDANLRRDMRAGAGGLDGTLVADPVGGGKFIATFANLSANDMLRICGGVDATGLAFVPAQASALWLGRFPGAFLEQTIYENDPAIAGGPVAGTCTAPLETPVTNATLTTPTSFAFGAVGVNGNSSAQKVEYQNNGGRTLTIYGAYMAGLNPNDFVITGTVPTTLAAGQKFAFNVAAKPTAIGLRQASLNLLCDAANTTYLSIPVTVTGNLDKAPSTPGAPALSLVPGSTIAVATPATIGSATAQVRMVWAAATGTVTKYELQQSLNGGAWTTVLNALPTQLTTTLTLPMGTTAAPNAYQFRVRAYANLTVSAFGTSMAFDFGPSDETDKVSFAFGGTWTTTAGAGFYGGTAASAATNANRVSMSMKKLALGSGALAVIGTMGPDRGIANISLDGGAAVAVDFYAPTLQTGVLVHVLNGTSANVKHTLTVVPSGTKRLASTGTKIEVDGFLALDRSTIVGPLLNAAPAVNEGGEEFSTPHPLEFAFRGVTPNPSNRDMAVAFGLPRDGDVDLRVLDVQGREIRTLQHGRMPAGVHSITWDGRDERGGRAGAGVYFAMLRHDGQMRVTRLVRLP